MADKYESPTQGNLEYTVFVTKEEAVRHDCLKYALWQAELEDSSTLSVDETLSIARKFTEFILNG